MVRLFALVFLTLLAYVPASLAATPEILTNPGMTTLSRLGKVSIDVHGKGCKQITNKFQTSDDLFIPFASKAEWESFLDYADSTNYIDVSPCPIAYGEWSYVGSCSTTCGGGTIVQTRSCTYTPTGQTLDCSYCGGECSQTVECNTMACAEWNRSCAAPAWNPRNNPATCGQTCTVTCIRDGTPVSASQCTGTPPTDYIPSNSCAGCAPGSETTGSHTASCSAGGLSGSGTIYVDDVRDCNGNIIPGRGTWTGVSNCCVPGLENTRTQNVNGISVAGCNAPACSGTHYTYHPVSCSKGNLSGSGKITVRVDTDCDGNNIAGSGYWTDVTGCCKPRALNTQTFRTDAASYNGCDAPISNCTFNGQTVLHGASVTAYQTTTVPYGSSCNSQSRTCNNGTLSGSYTKASCSVDPASNCTAPWGATVAHGSSITAYQTSSAAYGSTCTSQSRKCNNGTLSGSYTHSSCNVSEPACIWKISRKDRIPGRTCNNPPTTGKNCSCGETDVFDYANCTVYMSCSTR